MSASILPFTDMEINEPCEECGGVNYPNARYQLHNIKGILCRNCLELVEAQINASLLKVLGSTHVWQTPVPARIVEVMPTINSNLRGHGIK